MNEYELAQRNQDLMRLLAILVARAGGEVRIGPDELAVNRVLSRDQVGMTGVVVLRASTP